MIPRKKLNYYARNHGIQYFAAVKMTPEDISEVCRIVGSNPYGFPDCGGRLSQLIDLVMDDEMFVAKHRAKLESEGKTLHEDFFAMRLADYAADEVMAAYSSLHPEPSNETTGEETSETE